MTIGANGIVARNAAGVVTRDAFWKRVNALVTVLEARSVRQCALICDSTVEFAVGLVALAHTGAAVVLPPAAQAGSLRLCEADVDSVLTDRPNAFADFDVLTFPPPDAASPATPCALDDATPIYFYSSGSTGKPTRYRHTLGTHRQMALLLEKDWGDVLGAATIIATVPHYHRHGFIWAVTWPLFVGRPFYEKSCSMPGELAAAAGAFECVIMSSPAFLRRAAHTPQLLPPVEHVRALFSAGAPLPQKTIECLRAHWGLAPREGYGSTETGSLASRNWACESWPPPWRAFSFIETQLRPEAAGDRLWIKTPYTEGWIATGDLARYTDDGSFELLGRADGVVKVADKRISLDEMRVRLIDHDWVNDARLVKLTERRIQIGAVVVLANEGWHALEKTGRAAVRTALQTWLRHTYAPVLVPRKWRFIERWPDSGMGKVQTHYLKSLFEASK